MPKLPSEIRTAVWDFELDGEPHTLTLEHGYWTGKRLIRLDEEVLRRTPAAPIDFGGRYRFHVAGHTLVVRIRWAYLTWPVYDLTIDGVRVPARGQSGGKRRSSRGTTAAS